ncbi:hypothetical protein GRF29_1536g832726 [Pseudopithomyces chartarum]|uniref:Methyltransferase-domain-containing protein n=1 Tax=Pseudopithomyces chartarum TaxID=1892770 RepID=A0AAN6LNH7_9PLEO|nr:hypothetical protein GRF29_1536g832726 [Pseudopithomyces chartarum]
MQDRPPANLSDGDTNSESQSPPAEVPTIVNNVITWKTIQWTEGMRSLPVTIPLSRNYKQNGPLIVRIGTEPKSNYDELEKLLLPESRGVVSVWSAPFNLRDETSVSRTVERRFQIGDRVHRILEETGESIARHVWDAGVTLSCQLPHLLDKLGILGKSLKQAQSNVEVEEAQETEHPLRVVELGTGCGMVGITLSHLLPQGKVWLTDLSEASEIVELNLHLSKENHKNKASIGFTELDWEEPLSQKEWPSLDEPDQVVREGNYTDHVDLVIAADCTYNADSSPAFVNTIRQIAAGSPKAVVAIAMKRRHESEAIFFDLMSEARFETVDTIYLPLPGDEKAGEENVEIYIFKYIGEPSK